MLLEQRIVKPIVHIVTNGLEINMPIKEVMDVISQVDTLAKIRTSPLGKAINIIVIIMFILKVSGKIHDREDMEPNIDAYVFYFQTLSDEDIIQKTEQTPKHVTINQTLTLKNVVVHKNGNIVLHVFSTINFETFVMNTDANVQNDVENSNGIKGGNITFFNIYII